jgi:hypothetical protein
MHVLKLIKIRPALFELKHTKYRRDDRKDRRTVTVVRLCVLHVYVTQTAHKELNLRLTANDTKLSSRTSVVGGVQADTDAALKAETHATHLPETEE